VLFCTLVRCLSHLIMRPLLFPRPQERLAALTPGFNGADIANV
jgi:hypothetical protein